MKTVEINLLAAWIGILLGFVSGLVLGSFFHQENWLGGYGSFKRRLYRLAHISFFGLGAANLLFYFTAQKFPPNSTLPGVASIAFIIGAISMPLCCIVMANFLKARMLFAIPVISLIAGATITLVLIARAPSLNSQLSTLNFP